MASAETRLLGIAPGMYDKMKEMKAKYRPLYELDDDRFHRVYLRALKLNVLDGHCNDISLRKEQS